MKKADEILKSHNKFHIKLGLERIEKILTLLSNPQEKYKIIHVAGTNGKGSTCKIINEILINSGIKTGLFTSPHLFCYEERIKVNNENISSYIFDKLVNEIDSLALKEGIELSEFELLCAVAFYYFFIKGVSCVVLETGLGGKFDATNAVKNSLSVITTIDFDHKERLGDTIEKIALQKAGIIKENSKVVVCANNKGFEEIKNTAQEKNAILIEAPAIQTEFENGKNYAIINNQKTEFNLTGSFQAQNLSLAICAVKNSDFKISAPAIKKALKNVTWHFRAEYFKEKNILIDSAHNPQGAKALRQVLDENFTKSCKKTFIFGCLKNKEYEKMLDVLVKAKDELYFAEFNHPASLKFDELDKKYNAKKVQNLDEILKKDNLKIFCGSIYMLGEILKNADFIDFENR